MRIESNNTSLDTSFDDTPAASEEVPPEHLALAQNVLINFSATQFGELMDNMREAFEEVDNQS